MLLYAQQSKPTTVPAPRESQAPPRTNQLNPRSVLRAQSNIVRIDIEVTGRDGKTVKGLRADQFVITDDGKDQKISSFSYADIEAVEKAGTEDASRSSFQSTPGLSSPVRLLRTLSLIKSATAA